MRHNRIILKALIALILFAALPQAPVFSDGGEALAFLKLGAGTRATGMGGAFTSIADDASAAFYNPAGIVKLSGMEFMGETYFLSFGRHINYLAWVNPFMLDGIIYAAGISWLNYSAGDDIEARLTNSPEPDFKFSDSSDVTLFNLAAKIFDRLSIGANFRFVFETLDSYRGTGAGFDLGVLAKITDQLNAGISYNGIATNVSWNTINHTESLPQVINAGLSYKYENLFGTPGLSIMPAMDVVYNSFSGTKVRTGAEFAMNDSLFIRMGYNNAFTLGAGLRFRPSRIVDVKMDYAFTADTIVPAASNHRLGIVLTYVFPEIGMGNKDEGAKK
jgi:opacity protein-like surface antigen